MAKGKRPKKGAAKASKAKNVEEIFDEAEIAFMMEDFDTARTKYQQALRLDPNNVPVLGGYGIFLAEMGNIEEAVPMLQKSVELDPDNGFEKYLYLGQILDGPEAQQALRKGIEIIRKELQGVDASGADNPELEEIRTTLASQLSSALCALAEEIMSFSARQATAERGKGATVSPEDEALLTTAVEPLAKEAHELDPTSPEPMQVAANLALFCGKDEYAGQCLRASLACWYRPNTWRKLESDDESDDDKHDREMEEDDLELPSFEHRFETAKLLVELGIEGEAAVDILYGLLEENDASLLVWLTLSTGLLSVGEYEEADALLAEKNWSEMAAADEQEQETLDAIMYSQYVAHELLEEVERQSAEQEQGAGQ